MDALDKLTAKFKLAQAKQGQIINDSVRGEEGFILDMNRNEQLYAKGVTYQNKRIVPKYAPSTIRRKKKKGQPYDHVTLFDKGTWYKNFRIFYGSDNIEITALATILRRDFSLTSWLRKRYSPQIFGLTKSNMNRMRKRVLPKIIQRNKQLINA